MGRARYSQGHLTLTRSNLWQAHWFAYIRDPETGKERRHHRAKIVGCKKQMKRYQAEEELRKITHPINVQDGRIEEITLSWFMDHRWRPLHEGDWREESTRATNEYLLSIIRERFASTPLKSVDKVELQEWLNEMARKRSRSIVLHLRIFLKSICSEAVDQDYLLKDPARHLKPPKNSREPDKTVLTWDQLRQLFSALSERDRLILSIEGTAGLRPSELFALRRQSFDGERLTITETVYRGTIRPYGKTDGALTTVDLPASLASQISVWLDGQEDKSPDAFMFQNADGGFINKDNYLNRILYPMRKPLELPRLNFQVLRRTFSTLAQEHGTVKDVQRQMRHAKADTTVNNYMQPISESVQAMVSQMYVELLKPITEKVQ